MHNWLQTLLGQDEWLRSKGTVEKHSLRILGKYTPSLVRDLLWWSPKDILNVYEVRDDEVGALRKALQIGKDRVVGYNQYEEGSNQYLHPRIRLNPDHSGYEHYDDNRDGKNTSQDESDYQEESPENNNNGDNDRHPANSSSSECDEYYSSSKDEVESLRDDELKSLSDQDCESNTGVVTLLYNDSYQSLKALYAIDLFSSFTGAVAKAMATPIAGGAEEIRPDNDTEDTRWNIFSLRNNHLSKMIQDIHNTGLGNLDQIYLSVIVPLSQER
ncbi:hypothetical protein FPOAC2_07236 [Fusarium poae]